MATRTKTTAPEGTPGHLDDATYDRTAAEKHALSQLYVQNSAVQPGPAFFDEDDPEDETASDRVTAMLQSGQALDDKAFVSVHRIADHGKRVYCARYTPEQYEQGQLDMVRDAFGPGEYIITLYGRHPITGKPGVRASDMQTIAMPVQPHALPHLNQPQTQGSDPALAQVLAMMAQQQQTILEKLSQPAVQPDPMAQLQQTIALMASMRQAMGMDAPQAREKSSISEIVSAIKELKGAAQEFAPEPAADPDNPMSMLAPILGLVQQQMASQQQAQAMQPLPQVHLPAPITHTPRQAPVTYTPQPPVTHTPQPQPMVHTAAPDQPQQAQPAQPTQGDAMMNPLVLMQLKSYLNQLLDLAKQGPETIKAGADLIVEKLPDEMVELLDSDQWANMLCLVAPECKAHMEWLTSVRDLALAELFEGAPDDDAPAA